MNLLAVILSTLSRAVRGPLPVFLHSLQRRVAWRSSLFLAHALPIASRIAARIYRRPTAWWMGSTLVIGVMLTAATHEMRTSALQAWVLSHSATQLSYTLGPGPSPRIVFPDAGPFDERLGYTRIADFQHRLESQGYRVTAQVRFSDPAVRLAGWGVFPPYQEPPEAGLVIRDKEGTPIYSGAPIHGTFRDLAEVPPLIVNTLMFVEDRRLQKADDPRSNPVLDWPRMAKAATLYAGRKLGLPLPVEGGSTLATQLEKFQHSRDGNTGSAWEKLRQIVSASIRVYRRGADTRTERQEILLQYLNKVPLSAAPGWGEVNGLGAGLAAWFGMRLPDTLNALASPVRTAETARVYKHILALLCAARAPTHYLVRDRAALEARVAGFTALLSQAGVIDEDFAGQVRAAPIIFVSGAAGAPAHRALPSKVVERVRVRLGQQLGEVNGYNLDRLHLEADTTIDRHLQESVEEFFAGLQDRNYLQRQGLVGKRLLGGGDPRDVLYSFLLLERTPLGSVVRARVDSLEKPFDLNESLKVELGSTAKVRTLAHYLEVMADLHDVLTRLGGDRLRVPPAAAADPLTRWAAETLQARPGLDLEAFLRLALERSYSAHPGEVFFTGGGAHAFANYTPEENNRPYSVRQGLIHSVNLVYIRLMRDLVRFHTARLPYDARAVLADPDHPNRSRLLGEIAKAESRTVLARTYREYKGLPDREVERRLLGRHATDPRSLALLFYAWNPGADEGYLGRWLALRVGPLPADRVRGLARAYGSPQLTLVDFAYLLRRDPLVIWASGELVKAPELSWDALLLRSQDPVRAATAWLFQARNRRAQELRLRTRIEQEAFARMAPAWQRLGFPFETLIPSLATAIGSSSDRPDALAELLGIIRHDGVRDPLVSIPGIRLAAGTPYETTLERPPVRGERVMQPVVARLLREVLEGVVRDGTARRLAGVFTDGGGTALAAGGKTGSGDNRAKRVARDGRTMGSRPLSRTATFAFYLGDRHVGVITAIVTGSKAGEFHFTSALPVSILRLMAPILNGHLRLDALPPQSPKPTVGAVVPCGSLGVDPAVCPPHLLRQGSLLGRVGSMDPCRWTPKCALLGTLIRGERIGVAHWTDCGECLMQMPRPTCGQSVFAGGCAPRHRDLDPPAEAILAPEPPRVRLVTAG